MKVLTRYLLLSHIAPFVFAFIALTGVILINTLAKELASLAGKGLPMNVVLEFFVLSLPANIALTLPMAVLVAVLYTFSNLAAENEITALRASGVDLRRVALPLLLAGALLASGMVWFSNVVLPNSNYRWRVLMTDVAATRPLLALREQTINPIQTGDGLTPYYLEARDIDAESGKMSGVTIYDISDARITRTINADSGHMALNPSRTDLLLTLFNGDVREIDFANMANFQVVAFERQVMRLEGVQKGLERTDESGFRTDRDMTLEMMRARIDTLLVEREELLSGESSIAAQLDPGVPSDPGQDLAATLNDPKSVGEGTLGGVADSRSAVGPGEPIGDVAPAVDPSHVLGSPAGGGGGLGDAAGGVAAPAESSPADGDASVSDAQIPDLRVAVNEPPAGSSSVPASPGSVPGSLSQAPPAGGTSLAPPGLSSPPSGGQDQAPAASTPLPPSYAGMPPEPPEMVAGNDASADAAAQDTLQFNPDARMNFESERERYVDARIRSIEGQIREFQLEIQKKFSIAFASLVFVLIGIPIALRFPNGGIGMVIGVSLAIFGIYYVGLIGGEELADRGYVPPVIAMWSTNVIFGILGVIGFLRLGYEQGTGRGGGLAEMRWVRKLFRRRGGDPLAS
jgi:lipopolysaccharide export system permease protein